MPRISQPGGDFFGIKVADSGRVMTFAGGVPLKDRNGDVIGAVLVRGGAGKQDQKVAEAAAAAYEGTVQRAA